MTSFLLAALHMYRARVTAVGTEIGREIDAVQLMSSFI